jgi:hypothetical protein
MTRVIRPGPWQYVYILLLPALPLVLGVATIVTGFTMEEPDWGNRLFFGLLETAIGLVPAAWLLGMRVELTERDVSKVFLFGLRRETIPRDRLSANVETSADSYFNEIALAEFQRVSGPGAFKLYRKWVWRTADVDDLVLLATQPFDDDAPLHRQNRRLIIGLWLTGIVVVLAVGIGSWVVSATR